MAIAKSILFTQTATISEWPLPGSRGQCSKVWTQRPCARCSRKLRQTVYGPTKQAKNTPWAGKALVDIGKRSEREAAKIVAAWLESGVLTKGEYLHVESKHKVQRVVLDDAKAAAILASLNASTRPGDSE